MVFSAYVMKVLQYSRTVTQFNLDKCLVYNILRSIKIKFSTYMIKIVLKTNQDTKIRFVNFLWIMIVNLISWYIKPKAGVSIGLQSRLSIIYHIFLLLILNKDIFFHKNLLKTIGKLFDYNAISHILKSGWVGGGGKDCCFHPHNCRYTRWSVNVDFQISNLF